MNFTDRMHQIHEIVGGSRSDEIVEWKLDHSIWFGSWLLSEFGEGVFGYESLNEDVAPVVSADKAAEKMAYFFKPPGFVVDTPFPNTWEMWWESVADLINAGMIMNEGRPNYEGAMRGWKNRIKEQYGFRPSRTKEHTMTEQIKQMVSGAAKIVNSKKRGMHLPTEIISKAAKLMQGSGVQKKRKAEYNRLQKALNPLADTE